MKNWALERRRSTLYKRANIIQKIRSFFNNHGYLEVETPYRIPAPAPESYIDAVVSGSWFLHTSPEICMKRLLAAGYDKIFQICRCWREGERGGKHLPEFTLLEWYRSDCDYMGLMEECEELIPFIASSIGLGERLSYLGRSIDLTTPWERISVKDAFNSYSKISLSEALEHNLFDEIMVKDIEPRLGIKKPTFIYDYPSDRRAMARLKKSDHTIAERFELYIGSLEIANAFSELTDSQEQRNHFLKENENRKAMGKSSFPLPERFLNEIEDMPPSAGIALGVDRLVMVLLNIERIDEVVAFTPEEL